MPASPIPKSALTLGAAVVIAGLAAAPARAAIASNPCAGAKAGAKTGAKGARANADGTKTSATDGHMMTIGKAVNANPCAAK